MKFSHCKERAAALLSLVLACIGLPLVQAQVGSPGIQWINMEVSRVLNFYEAWTGQRVIMDAAIQSATITIITNEPMPDAEKAVFVEKSLLLNGFALIPAGSGMVKAVAVPGGSGQPRSEGLEVYAVPGDLPATDRLVAYVMQFEHLGADRAAEALAAVFPSHGYGTIVPFPEAGSVVITDSTAVIRRYLELKPYIDVPREDVPLAIREFALTRADATEVVEALTELLSLSQASTAAAGQQVAAATTTGGGATFAQVASVGQGVAQTILQSPSPDRARVEPKIRADVRTNKVLAVAEPRDMDYIETLIEFLDSPAPQRTLYTRQLNYLRVSTLLANLPNALLPGVDSTGTGVTGGETVESATGGNSTGSGLGNQFNNQSLNDGFSGSGSSGGGASLSGFEFGTDTGPQSLVVDKTFIMADNVHNRILATGPVEHLEIIDILIDELDRQPRQIQISTIIAQLTLGDDVEFGLDAIREIDSATDQNSFAGSQRARPGPILDVDTLLGVTNFSPLAQGLTLYGKIDDHLNLYLSALQSTNRFKVLARPTIYTQNDRLSVISTGQRIAVPSSTLSTLDPQNINQAVTSSISFEDVLLQLEVLPLINSDEQITLNIVQVNDDIVGSQNIGGNDIPTIGTQQLATTVVVPNGGTVLLGGLITEDDRKSQSGLPAFVTLPLVGPLFGNTNREKTRQELLVFIQPKIVDNEIDLAASQADMQARAQITEEALRFAAPPIRAEVEPVRKSFLSRIFERKPKESQPYPTRSPVEPAPILNRKSQP